MLGHAESASLGPHQPGAYKGVTYSWLGPFKGDIGVIYKGIIKGDHIRILGLNLGYIGVMFGFKV